MRDIKPPEAILSAVLTKAIDLQAAKRYYSNYTYFESQRGRIESSMKGKWVAALNGKLFSDSSLDRLKAIIGTVASSDRAYIEHVGRLV